MERRVILGAFGRCCVGAGLCAAMPKLALGTEQAAEDESVGHSCQEKIEFAEGWIKRLMDVLDQTTDGETRRRIMEANGRACAANYIASSGREIKPVAFADWVERLKQRPDDGSIRVEGRTIYFQYLKNYQGLDAPESFCLCPLVESKPKGISGTYCQCSVGYIRELFSRTFGQSVQVELLDSVLRGGKRCKFKIEVAA
ncbi:MAG: DUF6144 family protein [Acidobacteriota bacterium]